MLNSLANSTSVVTYTAPTNLGLTSLPLSHSVKDRIALNMINRAEQEGLISPGKTTLVRFAAREPWLSCHSVSQL